MDDGLLARIHGVEVLDGFIVRLTFTNGTQKRADLEPLFCGPLFRLIRRDRVESGRVRVDPELGTLVWPNGADPCPDVLYRGRVPAGPSPATR